jgi:hypothetical protein
MDLSLCWEANSHSACQEISCLLLEKKFSYYAHKSPLMECTLSQINPSMVSHSDSFKSTLITLSAVGFLNGIFHSRFMISSPNICYMTYISQPLFNCLTNMLYIYAEDYLKRLLIMLFSPSCTCSWTLNLHPILKHPLSILSNEVSLHFQ